MYHFSQSVNDETNSNLIRLADRTVSQFVKHYIENPLLRELSQILSRWWKSYSTTSIYSLIHYLEKMGIYFCKGGTGELVEKLAQLWSDME